MTWGWLEDDLRMTWGWLEDDLRMTWGWLEDDLRMTWGWLEEGLGISRSTLDTLAACYFITPMNFDNGFVNLDATTLLVHF